MFYYLSFLKAPPRESQLSQPISITCQITNDLRTEFYPHELDVYYAWILEENHSDIDITQFRYNTSSSFTKLTTWRTSNAYKETRISPPKTAKNGQRWRLILSSCHNDSPGPTSVLESKAVINISQKAFGNSPFPVISMPILFSSRLSQSGASSHAKQEEIERAFLFHLSEASTDDKTEAYFIIREKLSFDLDKVNQLI